MGAMFGSNHELRMLIEELRTMNIWLGRITEAIEIENEALCDGTCMPICKFCAPHGPVCGGEAHYYPDDQDICFFCKEEKS